MTSPADMTVVLRVLDDVRRMCKVKSDTEPMEFNEKIINITNQAIWDKLAILQDLYEQEADFVLNEMSKEKT